MKVYVSIYSTCKYMHTAHERSPSKYVYTVHERSPSKYVYTVHERSPSKYVYTVHESICVQCMHTCSTLVVSDTSRVLHVYISRTVHPANM